MHPRIVRLFSVEGPDRAAVVSSEPAASGGFLIRVGRGSGPGPYQKGNVLGPYPAAEIAEHFDQVVEGLRCDGFLVQGIEGQLGKLDSPSTATRARAALGLGWRRAHEAVEPILARLPKAVDEVCSYLDALGAIGDPRAVPVLREQAARKLLSRRRSAAEALRNLRDEAGLAVVRQQALERLPPAVKAVLALPPDELHKTALKTLLALDAAQRGLTLDTLYEMATGPALVRLVRAALAETPFDQPNLWRYIKSIHKRAILRHDYATFGWLSHAIERRGRTTTGVVATVKSGYDGKPREVRVFGRKTQNFMRRLSWRYLRQLASHRPEAYADAAASVLIAYTPEDTSKPKKLMGQFADCYLLTKILWGGGGRFVLSERTLRSRFRSPKDVTQPVDQREEAYPHLWDASPRAYLRLLGAAQLPEVQAFAIRAVEKRHLQVLHDAPSEEILLLLSAPFEPTAKLGRRELERRFNPQSPDWALLEQILATNRPIALELGERWLRLTAPLWTRDVERITTFLTIPHPGPQAAAAQLTIDHLDAALRPALAKRFLQLTGDSTLTDDRAGGFVRVARTLLMDELETALPFANLARWIERAPPNVLAVAGELLGRRKDGDVEIVVQLAQHDASAVRRGAHQLLRRLAPQLGDNTEPLFVLADSTWKDARLVAIDLLRDALTPDRLGFDEVMRLLDSSQVDVQDFGQSLARERLALLPAQGLVFRLVQHPHPNMRRFAMELAAVHLEPGIVALEKLEPFFRAVLFELTPDRALKHQVLDFLTKRGLADEQQAALAVRIFGDIVRMEGRGDFERALEGLVRLKLMFPSLAVPITLRLEDVA